MFLTLAFFGLLNWQYSLNIQQATTRMNCVWIDDISRTCHKYATNRLAYTKTSLKLAFSYSRVWVTTPHRGYTVYLKKYAHGFCFATLCCGCTLTDFPISIRLTSLALWQSNDCPSASKATLLNMDKYFIWIHYERLHNHNKAKHNKTACIFLGIYCIERKSLYHFILWSVC